MQNIVSCTLGNKYTVKLMAWRITTVWIILKSLLVACALYITDVCDTELKRNAVQVQMAGHMWLSSMTRWVLLQTGKLPR